MFKFATNKLNTATGRSSASGGGGGGGPSSSSTGTGTMLSSAAGGSTTTTTTTTVADFDSAASRRRQLQKDLFAFNKLADKGFPAKPSAIDYDKKLKLLAIATKSGDVRVYAAPRTKHQQMSSYQDVHPFPIQRMLFVQGAHQLITVSERQTRNEQTNKSESQLYLILWQIPNTQSSANTSSSANVSLVVDKCKECALEPRHVANGAKLSALALLNDNSHLFMGFESGDVYVFNVASFALVPGVISKDFVLKSVAALTNSSSNNNNGTSNQKALTQLGAVESIAHHPRQLTKLLIAYERGLWITFDFIKNQIESVQHSGAALESAAFYQSGECVATAHSDGSFILWDLVVSPNSNSISQQEQPAAPSSGGVTAAIASPANIVYGPYPCKAVSKCVVKTCRNEQPFVIFSGGCPRVNYSDKISISVIQGDSAHVCFDFTSKIVDFLTIDKPQVDKTASNTLVTYDNPQALVVLLEEELVAIDLVSEGWPQFRLPYLCSVHSSAIICTHYVSGVGAALYAKLKRSGELEHDTTPGADAYTDREWPIGNPIRYVIHMKNRLP